MNFISNSFIYITLFSLLYSFSSAGAEISSSAFSVDVENETIPACEHSDADPDGDGWGWDEKNLQSCYVGGEYEYKRLTICESSNSDPDGDGWGWENNSSCKVSKNSAETGLNNEDSSSNAPSNNNEITACTTTNSDPDGDGWGWENGDSCQVVEETTNTIVEEVEEEIDTVDSNTVPDISPATVSNNNSSGKLWGVTHGTTNNTNQYLGEDPSSSKAHKRQAIPFVSMHSEITALQINLRADNQIGRLGHYTVGDGGTIRVLLVEDKNCSPDLNKVIYDGSESVGDMSKWNNKSEFQAEYPGARWDDDSSTHTTSINGQKHFGTTPVTIGKRYWLVAEQVRGGKSNYPSINYFRSGESNDYAKNWLNRTEDPSADSKCILPKSQDTNNSSWKNLNRHPIYTVEGNNGIQGVPYYNQGSAPDDEPGKDRYSNVNSGDSIRNTWTVPGTKTIDKVHLCMMRQSGSGKVELRVDGKLVATWNASDFPTKKTEEYPATFEVASWESAEIDPITLSGSAVFEVTVTGSADMEMGSIKEGRIFVPLSTGTSGTPDILSEYRLNKGSWKIPDSGRIKYSIAFNEK